MKAGTVTVRRKRAALPKNTHMPQYGKVEGGRYHGWTFKFDGVLHDPKMWGNILFGFTATKARWPFPKYVVMGQSRGDFDKPVGEPKAKRLELAPLIEALLKRAPLPDITEFVK